MEQPIFQKEPFLSLDVATHQIWKSVPHIFFNHCPNIHRWTDGQRVFTIPSLRTATEDNYEDAACTQ